MEIIYPITLDYVKSWGPWECVREFATNALDADPGFRMYLADYRDQGLDDHMLVIESAGYLVEKHLLLGVSEKTSPNAIGQFGEGMKLAMLTLTRIGLRADIYSGPYHYWNEPAEMNGESVFKIAWEEKGDQCSIPDERTVVQIPRWGYPTYESCLIRPGDPRVLFTDPFGRMILDEPGDPQIYVKGVWVQKARSYAEDFAFGYNLVEAPMNRDRGLVGVYDIAREIGRLWASVTNPELLVQFWQAVQDQQGERLAGLVGQQLSDLKAHRRAFRAVFGQGAVVETDPSMSREAEYRGAEVVGNLSNTLHPIAEVLVGTDRQYVHELEGRSKILVPLTRLSDMQTTNLKLARRLARRIGFNGKIQPYVLPEKTIAEFENGCIRLGLQCLRTDKKTLRALFHEIGHQHGDPDTTAGHTEAALDAAVDVVLSYARR